MIKVFEADGNPDCCESGTCYENTRGQHPFRDMHGLWTLLSVILPHRFEQKKATTVATF
jgi:hypothetical protein